MIWSRMVRSLLYFIQGKCNTMEITQTSLIKLIYKHCVCYLFAQFTRDTVSASPNGVCLVTVLRLLFPFNTFPSQGAIWLLVLLGSLFPPPLGSLATAWVNVSGLSSDITQRQFTDEMLAFHTTFRLPAVTKHWVHRDAVPLVLSSSCWSRESLKQVFFKEGE